MSECSSEKLGRALASCEEISVDSAVEEQTALDPNDTRFFWDSSKRLLPKMEGEELSVRLRLGYADSKRANNFRNYRKGALENALR